MISYFSLVLCICISVSGASVEKLHLKQLSVKAREMLLENIDKLQNGTWIEIPYFRDDGFNILGQSSKFLSSNDFSSLLSTNKENNLILTQLFKFIVYQFSPYFVFEDDWFNYIVFTIMEDNFPDHLTLKSPETPDYTILMIFKYATSYYKKLKLPRYLHLAIISFFFEAVFGIGTPLPIDNPAQMIHFLGEKLLECDLPNTHEFFTDVLRINRFIHTVNTNSEKNTSAIDLLDFLSTKPNIEDHQIYYSANQSRRSYSSVDSLLFKQRILQIPDDEIDSFLELIVDISPCTKTFLNLINYNAVIEDRASHFPWIGPVLIKNIKLFSSHSNFLLSDQNIDDSMLASYNDWVISAYYKLDVISKLLNEYRKKLSRPPIRYYEFETLEVCIIEDIIPLNASIAFNNIYNRTVRYPLPELEFHRYLFGIEHFIPKQNPLFSLLAMGEFVIYFKEQLAGKFNLDVKYSFEKDTENPHKIKVCY